MQIRALGEIKSMALKYGVRYFPARRQCAGGVPVAVYFAYLAGIKEQQRRCYQPGPHLHIP